MIKWIQSQRWLPEIAVTLITALVYGVSDYLVQGVNALYISLALCFSLLFVRRFSLISSVLILGASIAEIQLDIDPVFGGLAAAFTVFCTAAFGESRWAIVTPFAAAISAIAVIWNISFNTQLLRSFYGVSIYNEQGRWSAFIVLSLGISILIALNWFLGGYLTARYNQKFLEKQQKVVTDKQLRLAVDLAEQSERFGIARDLNQVVSQQVSSMIALADGAIYASKVEPEVSLRTLERLRGLLSNAQAEMRKLHDSLNRSVSVQPAPPNIYDLDALVVQYRELGYQVSLAHEGVQVALNPSSELAIYRIVFDALDNVRKHAPLGTSVSIIFQWTEEGLQVLVKDNGVEYARRQKAAQLGTDELEPYNVNDDLDALVQDVSGPGITAMMERAATLDGSVEAKRVPGVGFTVSLIVPSFAHLTVK